MIKVKNGKAKLDGTPMELLKELSHATKATVKLFEQHHGREMAIDLVRKATELAFKTEEEIREEAHQKLRELLMMLAGVMDDELKQEGEQKDE